MRRTDGRKLEIQLAQVITRLRIDRPELASFGATYYSRGGDSALEDWWSNPFSAPSFDTLPDYLRDFLDAVESGYGDGLTAVSENVQFCTMTANGIKLRKWADAHGLTYKGAYRMYRAGQLPCRTKQLPTGTIICYPVEAETSKVVLYGRVSSNDQKADLSRQMDRLRHFSACRGFAVAQEVVEVGSGLNGRRQKLLKLLADKTVTAIVVEHRDRLSRFGVEYIEAALLAAGKALIVVNETEKTDDLVQDFVDVVTSLCARIYGRRSAKNRARRAVEAASHED